MWSRSDDDGVEWNWPELRVVASVAALGLVASALVMGGTDGGADTAVAETPLEPLVWSTVCDNADRAGVAQLVNILQRNRSADAAVLERAVYGLNIARRHCVNGWNDIAAEQYAWLTAYLDEHR